MLFIFLFRYVLGENKTVAVFNSWKFDNPPVKLTWESDQPDYLIDIKEFENPDGIWFRWGCSVLYHGKMIMIGGEPDAAPSPKWIYEISNCQITRTQYEVPFGMARILSFLSSDRLFFFEFFLKFEKFLNFFGI